MMTIEEAWGREKENTTVAFKYGSIMSINDAENDSWVILDFDDFDWSEVVTMPQNDNQQTTPEKITFDIDQYHGSYVMSCTTEKEAQIFCDYLNKMGRTWRDKTNYDKRATQWSINKDKTAYYFNEGCYGDVSEAEKTYAVLKFADFKW